MSQEAVNEVARVEADWSRAMVQNDADVIGRFIADDWIIVDPDGRINNRAFFLDLVRSGNLTHDVMEATEVNIRVYGDAAVLTARGLSSGLYRGEPFRLEERITDVFVKQDGRWRCVHTHLSHLET